MNALLLAPPYCCFGWMRAGGLPGTPPDVFPDPFPPPGPDPDEPDLPGPDPDPDPLDPVPRPLPVN